MSEMDDPFLLPLSSKDFDLQAARLQIALQAQSIRELRDWRTAFEKNVEDNYVCKHEFRPVMRLVYGMASLMLVAVVTAIVNSVLKGHGT